ncbi:MAG: hypothetical protein AB1344_01205 [Pseudomonadota bacterium]
MSPPELPAWARWMAVDADGALWVHAQEPLEHEHGGYENEVGRRLKIGQGEPDPRWRQSLERLG